MTDQVTNASDSIIHKPEVANKAGEGTAIQSAVHDAWGPKASSVAGEAAAAVSKAVDNLNLPQILIGHGTAIMPDVVPNAAPADIADAKSTLDKNLSAQAFNDLTAKGVPADIAKAFSDHDPNELANAMKELATNPAAMQNFSAAVSKEQQDMQAESKIQDAIVDGDAGALSQVLSQYKDNPAQLSAYVKAVEQNLSYSNTGASISMDGSNVYVSGKGDNHVLGIDTSTGSMKVYDGFVQQPDGSYKPGAVDSSTTPVDVGTAIRNETVHALEPKMTDYMLDEYKDTK